MRTDKFTRRGAVVFVIMLLTIAVLPLVEAPQYRSYPPNTVTVTTGTGTGTVDDLYSVDTVTYSVVEEDVGADSTLTATEEWIVQGTLDSGTFPDDTQTEDDTGIVYAEVDDDNGALTGDAVYLNPTGAGTYTGWTQSRDTNWECVDEDPHDGDATYVFTAGDMVVDTYAMEDLGVPVLGTKVAGTIDVVAWAKTVNAIGSGQGLILRVRTYAANDDGPMDLFLVQHVYQNVSNVWATNPVSAVEWTYAEINAMEVGIVSFNPVPLTTRTSSVGAVIPTQDLNYVLDVRHNITAIPPGRENYLLTMRAMLDSIPAETITVSVYDHVAPGWDAAFTFDANAYATETFALTEADHVNAGEIWLRYTDAAGDALGPDAFNIDLVNVRAWNVEYTLDVSFDWVGLDSQHDPRLNIVGYKSDAELITVQVLRSGAWVTLDPNIFIAGITISWAFTLSPADLEGNALQVRFIDNDITDNAASTIYLDLLTVRVEIRDDNPAAPIDVYVTVGYDLWANEIIINVRWVQSGGPEPAVETGKWAIVWTDGVELGTYQVGEGSRRIGAPWSYFDGNDHNITAIGAVNVAWPTWGGDQTYFSESDLIQISNFPRFAVLMFGLFCLLAVVAIVAVRAIQKRRKDDET